MVRFLSHQPDGHPELGTLDTDFGVSTTNSRGAFGSWNRSQELRLPRHFSDSNFCRKKVLDSKNTYEELRKCSMSLTCQCRRESVRYSPSCHNPDPDLQNPPQR